MPKRKSKLPAFLCLLLVLTIPGALSFIWMLPQRDTIQTDALPQEFFIKTDYNYIDFQTGNACSAYASAFVLRHLGEQVTGSALYPEIRRTAGFVPVHQVVRLFQNHGWHAAAYHGSIDTIKERLTAGVPVIAFVSIPGDTHYITVVGYDQDFLYLVDSLPDDSLTDGGWYNRKLSTAEFEEIWKTNMYPVKNIYIVVNPQPVSAGG